MSIQKKTKIVCTIGPVTGSVEVLTELVNAGMNVMRLNFSHGNFEEHQQRVDNLAIVRKNTGATVAVMQDLAGPKIRTGDFTTPTVTLKEGQKFTFTTDEAEKTKGDEKHTYMNYPLLPKEVKVGGHILVDDGKKRLVITAIKGKDVICKVISGGEIKGRRAVNLPGAYLSVSSLTEKDRVDLEFGVKNKVDFFALTFVRKAADIIELREILKQKKSNARIIAKIETPEALENMDEILKVVDGIMVARGDLGVEIPAEEVPAVQKNLIKRCNMLGIPVITATQMLESMIKNPIPTRAEVSDVANAIIDGTDAIMLSEETTLGLYPVKAVEMMTRIAHNIEPQTCPNAEMVAIDNYTDLTDIISRAAVRIAKKVNAKYIVALTKSGRTALMMARYRPSQPVLALMSNSRDANKLALSFGCQPIAVPQFETIGDIMAMVRKVATSHKFTKKGDKVVIVAGMPIGRIKETNMVLVETI